MLVGAASLMAANPTASTILGDMRRSLLKHPAVEAKFTINGGSGPVQGTMTMAGGAFNLSTPQLKVWYDGKTQWTYLQSTGEVSITEPDEDELAASNPFAILSSFDTRYKSRRLSDVNGCHRVELTPNATGSGISKILIVADAAGKSPRAITVTFDDGRQVSLVVDHIAGIAKPGQKAFTYDAKLVPASEIIDLR